MSKIVTVKNQKIIYKIGH